MSLHVDIHSHSALNVLASDTLEESRQLARKHGCEQRKNFILAFFFSSEEGKFIQNVCLQGYTHFIIVRSTNSVYKTTPQCAELHTGSEHIMLFHI